MFSASIAVLRKIVRALLAGDSPRELALGFTIGMMLGLMPKGNLIAVSLCVLLFSLRCNRGVGLLAALAFSFASPLIDPFAHKLGLLALNTQRLQATYASIFNMPLGPWLGFNNTVVTGSLLLNLYIAYPVYWITRVSIIGMRLAKAALRGQRPSAAWQMSVESTTPAGSAS